MAVRTIGELEDLLDSSLAWRKIELQALKTEIEKAEKNAPGAPLTRALARSGIALLYAHWEGFVKEACQAYVDYVAKRKLLYRELNDGFLTTSLLALQKQLASGSDVARAILLELVRVPDGVRARVPKDSIVDTKSNLRTAVLCDILNGVGFSSEPFETKGNLIDLSLCDARNSIAHGRDLYPPKGDFSQLHSQMIDLISDIRSLIMAAVRTKEYRADSAASMPA